MEANKKRKLKAGSQYDSIIPKPDGKTRTLSDSISVGHTIDSMKRIVAQHKRQLALLAPQLQGNTLGETLSNIWHFVYQHIQYNRDTPGKEELHTPARIWAKRKQGVDCDDYSIFQSAILSNLGIPHSFRVTKYRRDWQHVYVIVPDPQHPRGYWTLDPVTDKFDYEVPYTDKQDHEMSTVFLSGLGDTPQADVGVLPFFVWRFRRRQQQPQQAVGGAPRRTPKQIAERQRAWRLAYAQRNINRIEQAIATQQRHIARYEQIVARLKSNPNPAASRSAAQYERLIEHHKQLLNKLITIRNRLQAIIASNGNAISGLGIIRRNPAKQAARAAKKAARQAARASGASRRQARQAGRAAAQAVRAGQPNSAAAPGAAAGTRRAQRRAKRAARKQARQQARQQRKQSRQEVRMNRRQRRQAAKQQRQAAKQQRRQNRLEARQKRRDTRSEARQKRRERKNAQNPQELQPQESQTPQNPQPQESQTPQIEPNKEMELPSAAPTPESPAAPNNEAPSPSAEPEWNAWAEEGDSFPTTPTGGERSSSGSSAPSVSWEDENFDDWTGDAEAGWENEGWEDENFDDWTGDAEAGWDEEGWYEEGWYEEGWDEEGWDEEMEGINGFDEWNWDEANDNFFIGNTPAAPAAPAAPARVRSRRMGRGGVKRLQRALQAHGLQVTVNGQMDAQTNAALLQAEERGLLKLQSREPVVIAPTELRRFVQASRALMKQQGKVRRSRARQAATTPAPTPVVTPVPAPAPSVTPSFVVDSRSLPVPATTQPSATPALRTGRSEADAIDVEAQDVTPTATRSITPTTRQRTGIVQRITDTINRQPAIAIGAAALVVGGLYLMSKNSKKSVNGLSGVKRKKYKAKATKRRRTLGDIGETFGELPLR